MKNEPKSRKLTLNRHHPAAKLYQEHKTLAILMAINIIVFILQKILPERIIDPYFCHPSEIAAAWQGLLSGDISLAGIRSFAGLVTYAFFHASIEHIGSNLFSLWIFGYLVGELLGKRWVLAIYLLTAIGGGICFTIFKHDVPYSTMLGASGAVLGFQGAYLGLAVRYSLPNPHVWPMARPVSPIVLVALVIIGLYFDYSGAFGERGGGIAYVAHLGGAITGLLLTSFVTPFPNGAERR